MPKKINKDLTEEQEEVLFKKGTEAPFSGKYLYSDDEGVYHCANCNNPLFASKSKFDSSCGWPSFYEPIKKDAIYYKKDSSHGLERVEVVCAHCGGHLGHVFPDAPQEPTGQRFCINSAALELEEE